MDQNIYYKITNEQECHHGFQYRDGLNILQEKFNDNKKASCCAGGFYFSDASNISAFLCYGVFLREVSLPMEQPGFKWIPDPEGNKWRSNMINLGCKYDLRDTNTLEKLIKCFFKSSLDYHRLLIWGVKRGYLDVVRTLIEKADISRDMMQDALNEAVHNNHLEIVKYCLEKGADIHNDDDYVLRQCAKLGYFEMLFYLVEIGADIHADNDGALRWSSRNGHLRIVDYLIKRGANVRANNDYAFVWSAQNGYLEVVKLLVANGADIYAEEGDAFFWAAIEGHVPVVKYLASQGFRNICLFEKILACCARKGNLPMIKCLIDLGIDIHFNDDNLIL